MNLDMLPGSCATLVIWNFNTDNQGEIETFIKRAINDNRKLKAFMATTSSAGDRENWGADHRQIAANQDAAEAALRACGFKRTRPLMNDKHHHPDTKIRIWWRGINVE